jgi:hypothetical protein
VISWMLASSSATSSTSQSVWPSSTAVRRCGAGHVHGPVILRGVAVAQDGLHQRVAGLEGIHAHALAGGGVGERSLGAVDGKERLLRVSRNKRAEGVDE